MIHSLLPEKPLLISPSLAATIGLEEAILLPTLADLINYRETVIEEGFEWVTIDNETLLSLLPFWTQQDLQRISKSLRDTGLILIGSPPLTHSQVLKYALNETAEDNHLIEVDRTTSGHAPVNRIHQQPHQNYHSGATDTPPAKASHTSTQKQEQTQQPNSAKRRAQRMAKIQAETGRRQAYADANYSRSASFIAPNWLPSDDILKQLSMQGVPTSFAQTQVPEFITYWTERREAHFSWGSKFVNRVIHLWRDNQSVQNAQQQSDAITASWRPSEDAIEILHRIDISPDFIEDTIPEFVLYWKERGEPSKTWNSKFITHVKQQWARVSSALQHDPTPSRIPQNWQPSRDVFDVLKLANINRDFADGLVAEFVIFWHDTNEVARSWNSKFLQHVKYHWAKQHNFSTNQLTNPVGNYNAQQQRRSGPNQQKSSTFERLTDRSWADGA